MKKTIAIMQPYFLPYIGYFQLLNSVSTFVIFDDVNFIRQGYICSNNILISGAPYKFSIPVKNKSQNKLICETELAFSPKDKERFLRMITLSYKKAPYFDSVFSLIKEIIMYETEDLTLFIKHSLEIVSTYLGISTKIVLSSDLDVGLGLKGEERIIEICKTLGAKTYINAIGGTSLYDFKTFRINGLELKFLKTNDYSYQQFSGKGFVTNLSIIDVMMFNSKDELKSLLNNYSLIGELDC